LRSPSGAVEELPVGGSLLGLFEDVTVGVRSITLRAGETLVLLTDGMLEAHRDGAFFEHEGVARVLGRPWADAESVAAGLVDAVVEHCGGSLADDIAALVLRIAP
jgi:serine phosphatase RsbU (regulator of sigma subunit)